MKIVIFNNPYKNVVYQETDELLLHNIQLEQLELIGNNNASAHSCDMKRAILKKFQSYKSQDKKSNKYDDEKHITKDELIEKLKKSKLICYYCNNEVYIIYNQIRSPSQWSLERFDNNKGHYNNNTCISCLKCNLQRRTDNHEYFKYSKNMKVSKINAIEYDE